MTKTEKLTVAKRPCGSCPYRRDVPSGVWAAHEYDKLLAYDALTFEQPMSRFDCHQRDGNLCAGWVACHGMEGPTALLSLRCLHSRKRLSRAVYNYKTDVPVWGSGAEAKAHGMAEYEKPPEQATKLQQKLLKLGGVRYDEDGDDA